MRAKLCVIFTLGFFVTATMLVFDMAPRNIAITYEMKSHVDEILENRRKNQIDLHEITKLDEKSKKIKEEIPTSNSTSLNQTNVRRLTSYDAQKTMTISQIMQATLNEIKLKLLQNISSLKYSEILNKTIQGEPLLPKTLPTPKKVVIVSTWRSGSTFLEALLGTQPGTFDFYEPLSMLRLVRAKEGEVAELAQAVVRSLLDCSYDEPSYMEALQQDSELTTRNVQVKDFCKDKLPGLCTNRVFISNACKIYPWKLMKLVRLKLSLLKPILEDPLHSDVRVILLVRDPRAVMNSRTATVQWCTKGEECISPESLCQDMENDFNSAREFGKLFPGRINILRYEDLMSNPYDTTKNLFNTIGLDYRPETEEFLKEHTTTELDKPWTTSRDSKKRLLYWTHMLKSGELNNIQRACSKAMRHFGYKIVNQLGGNTKIEEVLSPVENDLKTLAIT